MGHQAPGDGAARLPQGLYRNTGLGPTLEPPRPSFCSAEARHERRGAAGFHRAAHRLQKLRDAYAGTGVIRSGLKQKGKDRTTAKLGKIDIDYVLHAPVFNRSRRTQDVQSRRVVLRGQGVRDGLGAIRGALRSKEVPEALGMSDAAPRSHQHAAIGPPPCRDAQEPEDRRCPPGDLGRFVQVHPGGWGKPPDDEYATPSAATCSACTVSTTIAPPDADRVDTNAPVRGAGWASLLFTETANEEDEEDEEDGDGTELGCSLTTFVGKPSRPCRRRATTSSRRPRASSTFARVGRASAWACSTRFYRRRTRASRRTTAWAARGRRVPSETTLVPGSKERSPVGGGLRKRQARASPRLRCRGPQRGSGRGGRGGEVRAQGWRRPKAMTARDRTWWRIMARRAGGTAIVGDAKDAKKFKFRVRIFGSLAATILARRGRGRPPPASMK